MPKYIDVKAITTPDYPVVNLAMLENILTSLNIRLDNLEKDITEIKQQLKQGNKIDFI